MMRNYAMNNRPATIPKWFHESNRFRSDSRDILLFYLKITKLEKERKNFQIEMISYLH